MRLIDFQRNSELTDLNCSEACRSTRMTSNLADRLDSPGQIKKIKIDRLLENTYILMVFISCVNNLHLHAGHTRLLLNSLVPSSSQKISFHNIKDV